MFIIMALHEEAESLSDKLEALLALMAQGDKDALAELYELTYPSVYGFAMSMSQTPHDAEDILQETFINAFNAADRYVPHGKPMAWLMTIAKNLARMRLRELGKTTHLPDEDWSCYLSDKQSVTSDERILLTKALELLSETEQQIVMLFAVSGLKHREIAQLLDLPLATVLSKYSRAIKKLKNEMEAE